MQLHDVKKNFWPKLVRFGQIWFDLVEIWAKSKSYITKNIQSSIRL